MAANRDRARQQRRDATTAYLAALPAEDRQVFAAIAKAEGVAPYTLIADAVAEVIADYLARRARAPGLPKRDDEGEVRFAERTVVEVADRFIRGRGRWGSGR